LVSIHSDAEVEIPSTNVKKIMRAQGLSIIALPQRRPYPEGVYPTASVAALRGVRWDWSRCLFFYPKKRRLRPTVVDP